MVCCSARQACPLAAVTITDALQAAESYMSLANVTSHRLNDQLFSQAIAYLQEASDMQDYALPEHLEQYDHHPYLDLPSNQNRYLEENGPLY